MRRRPTLVASALAIGVATLVTAGCGGGGKSPGVADLATGATTATGAATTTTSSLGAGGTAKGPGGGGGQFQIAMRMPNAADGAKFSACMRKHGVTSFPDPNSQGVIEIHSGMGIDPGSPSFQSARSACQTLLPNGGKPTPAQQAQQQRQLLAFSACMRAHGIKDFPDPTNGGLQIHVQPGSDLQPGNPQFQRAQQACRADLPFKGAGFGAPAK